MRISRALGLKQLHITPTLSETVQPVILVGDVSQQPTGVIPSFRMSRQLIFGAADFGFAILSNPVQSGVLARIKQIEFSMTHAGAFEIGISPASGVAIGLPVKAFQTNGIGVPAAGQPANSTLVTQMFEGGAVGGNGQWGLYRMATGVTYLIRPNDLVLAPGAQIIVGNQAVGALNDVLDVNFDWTEEPNTAGTGL